QPSEQTTELLTDLENHQADSTSVRQELTRSQMEGTGEDQPSLSVVKQEPPDSGDEVEPEEEEVPETYTSGSEDGELVRKEDQLDDSTEVKVKEEPQSGSEEEDEEDMEEDDLVASMPLGSDGVLPSIMMDQMELLELEMRARAIKAMLSSHDEGD
ncbi:caspase activity and apoptosis inhibitor 1, partial [Biomphalaria pfeifferi]